MKFIIILVLLGGLSYYGVTLPEGGHIKAGFSESKGLHLVMN